MQWKVVKNFSLFVFVGTLIFTFSNANAAVTGVSTFESIGIYWSPSGGSSSNNCSVNYRKAGEAAFKEGLPLWFDSHSSEYRGSIVNLVPGTTYEIKLTLDSGDSETFLQKTWSEHFPIQNTIYLPENSGSAYTVSQSGNPDGYVLYTHSPGTSATIDVKNKADNCIIISPGVHHVIIKGLTLKGGAKNGIFLGAGTHDIVIENNDISAWGDGSNYQAAVFSTYHSSPDVERIIIQRNRIHHPNVGANSWDDGHPLGPQAVAFENSLGNHVIRYNEIYSQDGRYFNDGLGYGSNFGNQGFPNKDSDIYGNIIQNCWDDGIESEGANQNVRIWGNYLDKTFVKIAIASTSKGPIYIFRNVVGASRKSEYENDSDLYLRGPFIKAGGRKNEYNHGRVYIFHNTILQPEAADKTYTLGCDGGILASGGKYYETISRNNIFTNYRDWHKTIQDLTDGSTNDFDYDLYMGLIPAETENHGLNSEPIYCSENGPGEYALQPGSSGFDAGVIIPNFNDDYDGVAPDIGAYEYGQNPMEFGVDAYLNENSASNLPIEDLLIEDLMIEEHGAYSQAYQSDWSSLETGKVLAKKDLSNISFKNVIGEDYKQSFATDKPVTLKDLALNVKWTTSEPNKFKTTLFHIRNSPIVTLDNVSIIQADPDYRAYNTILIEDCGDVIIKNSYFAGTVNHFHIRIEGCKRVFIDGVEVSGYSYPQGMRAGGGIMINNGEADRATDTYTGTFSPNPNNLEWGVIQNSYFHDYLDREEKWRNHDAILVHSPADGIIFNNYFENWLEGDAAVDAGHRRNDIAYDNNHAYRIERNVFDNSKLTKTNGLSSPNNLIIWVNNLYINTYHAYYHSGGWESYHLHNTFYFNNANSNRLLALWNLDGGQGILKNNLIFNSGSFDSIIYQNDAGPPEKYANIHPDNNLYLMNTANHWVTGHGELVNDFNEWQSMGNDTQSVLDQGECFLDKDNHDFRVTPACPGISLGTDQFLQNPDSAVRVDQDFYGVPRATSPTVGAFEFQGS